MKAPTLSELKTKELTVPELQAAVLQLVKLHNEMAAELNRLKGSGQIMSRQDAIMNTRYGL